MLHSQPTSLAIAVLLAASMQLASHAVLRRSALRSEMAGVPQVARARARLTDARRRHRLADCLRRTARMRIRTRYEADLMPPERLDLVRRDLLQLADAVEGAEKAEPLVLHEIEALLSNVTRSPLLNPAIPERELHATLRRARLHLNTGAMVVRRPSG